MIMNLNVVKMSLAFGISMGLLETQYIHNML